MILYCPNRPSISASIGKSDVYAREASSWMWSTPGRLVMGACSATLSHRRRADPPYVPGSEAGATVTIRPAGLQKKRTGTRAAVDLRAGCRPFGGAIRARRLFLYRETRRRHPRRHLSDGPASAADRLCRVRGLYEARPKSRQMRKPRVEHGRASSLCWPRLSKLPTGNRGGSRIDEDTCRRSARSTAPRTSSGRLRQGQRDQSVKVTALGKRSGPRAHGCSRQPRPPKPANYMLKRGCLHAVSRRGRNICLSQQRRRTSMRGIAIGRQARW